MMEQRCKTCRWWVDPKNNEALANVKQCTSPKVMFADTRVRYEDDRNWEVELAVESDRSGDPHHVLSGDEAAVVDGSGYYAALFPAPDFGCIHWDGK